MHVYKIALGYSVTEVRVTAVNFDHAVKLAKKYQKKMNKQEGYKMKDIFIDTVERLADLEKL